jgi:hypothetical protein
MAPSLYSIVQEMGRVDRVPLGHDIGNDIDHTQNRYEVHLSFTCAVKLYARVMQHPEKTEREIQLGSFMEVLGFLVVPDECQHVILERYFEAPDTTRLFESCRHSCHICNRRSATATGRINRQKLTRQLVGYCTSASPRQQGPKEEERSRYTQRRDDSAQEGGDSIQSNCAGRSQVRSLQQLQVNSKGDSDNGRNI